MTDDQINVAITEATGLWNHPYSSDTRVMMGFCRDLNAMHEAESTMTDMQWFYFLGELHSVVRLPNQSETQIKQVVHSTARQRAEAFLRTLGKWEDGK